MTIFSYIIKDFKQPLDYIPAGIAAAFFACVFINVVYMAFYRFTKRRTVPPRSAAALKNILLFVFILYIFVVLQEAFFSRPPGSRNSVNMTLLDTWGESFQSKAYVIENVLMFIPFGFLLPALLPPFRRLWLCMLTAVALSTLLEYVQYVTARGHCQLDDVVMNTLGAVIGGLIFRFVFLSLTIPKPHK